MRPCKGYRGLLTCRQDERGGSLLLFAVLLPAVIGFAGLAVDVRNGYAVHTVLQHAVDDGALTALRWGDQVDSGVPGPSPKVIAEALRVVRDDLEAQGIPSFNVDTTLTEGAFTVRATSRVPTYFLPLFGLRSWTIQAHAAAPWGRPSGAQTPLVLLVEAPSGNPGTVGGQGASSYSVPGGDNALGGGGEGGRSSGLVDERSPATREADTTATVDQAPPGPCNCDGIVAGDPQTAREALDRMGVTPADPGPFQGDFTAEMGLQDMSAPGNDSQGGGDEEW
jgi:hypothetical protein